MNSKRSYLDTLNAGRQRKEGTTLEQITQSLQNLESRLGRSREAAGDFRRDSREAGGHTRHAATADAGHAPHEHEALPSWAQERQAHGPVSGSAPHSFSRDFDRVSDQEEGIASAGRIAGELKTLREDLRRQAASNTQGEFEALRGQLGRMLASNLDTAALGSDPAAEMDRISRALHDLSDRADDKGVNALRTEIGHLRDALDTLAREDTVRTSDRRPDDLDRRWSAPENRIDKRPGRHDREISALADRLQTISDAVSSLPQTLSMQSLEERVRTLAVAVEHFVRQHERQTPEMFRLVEERLDEISRAIVASTAVAKSPPANLEPFHRIEARISALARQIDEVAQDLPSAEIIDRLKVLSQRVDGLAAQGTFPELAMERLSRQVLAIAEKIDRTPADAERKAMLASIDQRFEILSVMIERRQADAMEHGSIMFRDLERRLDEVADRIGFGTARALDVTHAMGSIEARFADLANQFAETASKDDGEAIRGLETRLEGISARIDANAAKYAGVDPDLIRSLESQVAVLSSHLGKPSAPLPELEDIGPRLNELERAIADNRDSILQAARQAAENAMLSFDGSRSQTVAVAELAQDLKALEGLARRSDERNARTFKAIHDTLIRIVDHLGLLEAGEPSTTPTGWMGEFSDTSSSPADRDEGSDIGDARPAEPRSKSILGGLARVIAGKETASATRKAQAQPASFTDQEREPAVIEPLGPEVANRPLEPGSGAPDLNAIMRRVRGERAQTAQTDESETSRADFIAAARRAAQAAAADAEMTRRNEGAPRAADGAGIGAFRRRRAPILMAATAISIVLAGLHLGKTFFAGSEETAAADMPLTAAGELPPTAQIGAPVRSAGDPTISYPEDGDDYASDGFTAAAEPPGTAEAAPPEMAMHTGETASGEPAAVRAVSPQPPDAATAAPEGSPATLTGAAGQTIAPADKAVVTAVSVSADAGPAALREAAESGDTKALFELGSRYADGRGVKQDMGQASIWYEKSAELGFAPAQYRIGNLYEKALGVERDAAKAKTWYQLAAEQGNASAMHNLAVLHAMGADGAPDNESAARWFRSAAELGVKDSQYNLGILAAKGVGMARSLEESYKWFALAAKSGDSDAASKRDEIANALSPDQLTTAKAAVELWKSAPVNPEANSVEIPESWQVDNGTTATIDMKKAVGNIQLILNKNGYDAGSADGVMGERTNSAIKAFQKDNGMAPNGQIDEKLVRALLAKK